MRVVICFSILCFLLACGTGLPDENAIIDKLYKERVEDLKKRRDRDCRARALTDAETHVDSIVYQLLNADLVDSIRFPIRPARPTAPDHIIGTVSKFKVEGG